MFIKMEMDRDARSATAIFGCEHCDHEYKGVRFYDEKMAEMKCPVCKKKADRAEYTPDARKQV